MQFIGAVWGSMSIIMSIARKVAFFAWFLIALFFVGKWVWGIIYPSGSFHYKMTVAIETPEGDKIGSAVREVSMWRNPRIFPEAGAGGAVLSRGEAVVVDLGRQGVVFALLRGLGGDADHGDRVVYKALPCPYGADTPLSKKCVEYYISKKDSETAAVAFEHYPQFVYFEDIEDPKTIKNLIDVKRCPDPRTGIPDKLLCLEKDHFEEVFGEGVRLKSVVVEITDEDIIWSLDDLLPYGKDISFREWYRSLPYGDPRAVTRDLLQRGK